MNLETIVKKISATIAALVIIVFAGLTYLQYKGYDLSPFYNSLRQWSLNEMASTMKEVSDSHVDANASETEVAKTKDATSKNDEAKEVKVEEPTKVVEVKESAQSVYNKKRIEKLMGQRFEGDVSAPVTMYEIVSFTCSHCAELHHKTLPEFKKKYVETGKVKVVLWDFPLDGRAMAASMISKCVARDKYFPFVSTLFDMQSAWAYSKEGEEKLYSYAMLAGLTKDKILECKSDKMLFEAINEESQQASERYKVSGTPTIVITNGIRQVIIEGSSGPETLGAAVDKLLGNE